MTGPEIVASRASVVLQGLSQQDSAGGDPLEKAFEALASYDWGTDRSLLQPIDDAVQATSGQPEARRELEKRLAGVLTSSASRAAKDYVCRVLSRIGTAVCVPGLKEILLSPELSHMARFALERIPDQEAVAALREALPQATGSVRVGIIHSLGVRQDEASVPALVALLQDKEPEVVSAAARALGSIGTPAASKALLAFVFQAPEEAKAEVFDACLVCAERLAASGQKPQAMLIYKALNKAELPKHIRVAATRGLLALMGQK